MLPPKETNNFSAVLVFLFFLLVFFNIIRFSSFFLAVHFFDTCEPRCGPFAIKSNDAGIVKPRIAFSIVVKVYAAYTHLH